MNPILFSVTGILRFFYFINLWSLHETGRNLRPTNPPTTGLIENFEFYGKNNAHA
jgi:hypothetical protein